MKKLLDQIDFALIAAWVILYPAKDSKAYFLGFALLAAVMLWRAFLVERHIIISGFSTGLGLAVLLLLGSVLTAPNRQNALLFLCDLVLAALIVISFDNGRRDREQAVRIMVYLVSITSLVTVVLRLAGTPPNPGFFFANPILQGVLSGLAVLMLISFLREGFAAFYWILLIVNLAAVFASSSKAAFIGTVVFGFFSIPRSRKRWMLALLTLTLLTFIIPNPVNTMFRNSLKQDPYAFDRVRIWATSLRVGQAYFPWGTGLGSFGSVAPAFNFPQEKGPARFFKVPRKTHNDYLKLFAESGIFGIAALLILVVAVARRLRARSILHQSGPAVLYLLFQAFLFNLLFLLPFLLLSLFLLGDWIESPHTYQSPTPALRLVLAAFLFLLIIFGYILPFLSNHHLEAARNEADFIKAANHARAAARLTPLAPEPHLLLADLHTRFDEVSPSLLILANARYHLQRARRLNPYSAETSLLEARLLERSIQRDLKYAGLESEIISCLDRARDAAPLNPFIRMHRARIRFEFNHDEAAAGEARAALELEPRFLEARVFLQRYFPQPNSEAEFVREVSAILELRQRKHLRPGSYLHELFSLPPAERGWLRGTFPGISFSAAPQES
ncbi:MAG: O-antigen ligase family protein [Candidatus Aminicenantes bacterium]|nr:O-antigen ligase family protein [Candidatus Aminicenantes bacterium]